MGKMKTTSSINQARHSVQNNPIASKAQVQAAQTQAQAKPKKEPALKPPPEHKVFTDGFGGAVYGSKNPDKTLKLDDGKALTNEHQRLAGLEANARTEGVKGRKEGGAGLSKNTNFFATSFGAVHTQGAYTKSAGSTVPPPEAMKRMYHPNVHDLTNDGKRVSVSGMKDSSTKTPGYEFSGSKVAGSDDFGRTPKRNALQAGAPAEARYSKPTPPSADFNTTFAHSEQSDAARLMAPGAAKDIAASFKGTLPPGSKIHAVTYSGHTTRFTCANCEYTTGHLAKNPGLFRKDLSAELQAQGFQVPKDGVRLLPIISAHEKTNGVRQNPQTPRRPLEAGEVDLKDLAGKGKFIETPLANVK
ncbi:hypothetical protein [Corallococcus exiguus]|uniref:hypothetical protein n=1 Tax=Corallococcus exiguus TaxID=83462 RepID=UPI001560C776|nr:hypothetical protein [Corallococcus exiguus]NRD43154.1 hypothetical protein [Corallococcus exiguus]